MEIDHAMYIKHYICRLWTCCLSPSLMKYLAICGLCLVNLIGCPESPTERACEPGRQEGCPDDQHCTLDEQLTPYCEALPLDPKPLGSTCALSDECGISAGCVSIEGVSRCVALCALDLDEERSSAQCVERAGEGSRCSYALPKRPEIGACVTPCDLASSSSSDEMPSDNTSSETCPPDQSCVLSTLLTYPSCALYGDAPKRAPCGAYSRCGAGLSCLTRGVERRCQSVWKRAEGEDDRCPVGEVALPIEGALDPTSSEPYFACWARVEITLSEREVDDPPYEYYLELTPRSSIESESRCALGGDALSLGQLAKDLEERSSFGLTLSAELIPLLDLAGVSDSGVWVGSGDDLNTDLNTDPETVCQQLNLMTGVVEPISCELTRPALCEVRRSSL